MTKRVRFHGYSDDNFAYDEWKDGRWGGGDEIGQETAAWVIEDFGNQGLQVFGTYAPKEIDGGVWVVGVAPLDEDEQFPDWPMKFELHENGYSLALVIDLPDSAKIRPSKGSKPDSEDGD